MKTLIKTLIKQIVLEQRSIIPGENPEIGSHETRLSNSNQNISSSVGTSSTNNEYDLLTELETSSEHIDAVINIMENILKAERQNGNTNVDKKDLALISKIVQSLKEVENNIERVRIHEVYKNTTQEID